MPFRINPVGEFLAWKGIVFYYIVKYMLMTINEVLKRYILHIDDITGNIMLWVHAPGSKLAPVRLCRELFSPAQWMGN
jgi:hypothetical protein